MDGHVLFRPDNEAGENVPALIYAFDPATSQLEALDGLGSVVAATAQLNDTTRTLIQTTTATDGGGGGGSIVTYTLPPHLFLLPKCCDRDL